MTTKFATAPVPVRHARLIGLISDLRGEVQFSGVPEATKSALTLLDEAEAIVRSLQQQGVNPSDMTMVVD